MRKLSGLVAALGLVMSTAQPAHAVVQAITSATLSLSIGSLPTVVLAWSGGGTADLTGTSITNLTPGILSYTGILEITDPGLAPMQFLSIEGATNGVGNFFGIDTVAGGGPMAVTGVSNICLAGPCGAVANITVPFTTGGVNGVGLGGAPIVPPPGFVNVTLMGNMWTTGTVAIGPYTASGTPLYDGGHVKLVTPTVILTSNPAFPVIPSFAFLELNIVPEPGTLLLLASGVAGLAMVGRKRMSK